MNEQLRKNDRETGRLGLDRSVLHRDLNSRPFTIAHKLAEHPLFQLERLIELARRLPPGNVEYNAGDIPVNMDPMRTPMNGLPVEETIRRIQSCRSWMVLKWVELDSLYARLLGDCLDEVRAHSEAVAPGMCDRQGFIFISSPEAVTPFHFDQELNFLLQIHGNKTVHVFPQNLITEIEREQRFATTHRNLNFLEEYQQSANTFRLTPGMGLHIPVAAPHWVKNGSEFSISFSITFQTSASMRCSSLYRVNGHMRSIGLRPRPVGDSRLFDTTKYCLFQALRYSMRPVRQLMTSHKH